jgi:rare lipoprotein A
VRRFRTRRRRSAALTLLPLAAITTATTITPAPAAGTDDARLDASEGTVRAGHAVTLSGAFPGPAADQIVEIRKRRRGSDTWRVVRRTRTNDAGAFRERFQPRATAYWRADLVLPERNAKPALREADRRTDRTRVRVRSRTRAELSTRHARVGDEVVIEGRVLPGSRRDVTVEVGGDALRTHTDSKGRLREEWRPGHTGTYDVRVVARGTRSTLGSQDGLGEVTVYRPAQASWYGPGLYGNRTACGQTLTPSIQGVAHRSMPCGTKLTLRYGHNTVEVRVIDRGPYAAGREFDLTYATKQRLGFPDTGTVLSSR